VKDKLNNSIKVIFQKKRELKLLKKRLNKEELEELLKKKLVNMSKKSQELQEPKKLKKQIFSGRNKTL